VTDPHPRVVWEIVGQPATDFFWCSPVTQPGEHMIHKLVVFHSIRLMGELFAFIGMMLGLLGEIDSLPRHPRVELVAQIWSQVRVDSLRRPGPAPDFTGENSAAPQLVT
jgi:hypothetical protein